MLARLSRWCYHRRRHVVALWILGFIALNALSGAVGNAYNDSFSGGHSDSAAAFELLRSRFPARAGDTADIVFRADEGVRDPGVRAQIQALFAGVGPGKLEHVVAIDSPYDAPGRVSADGKVAYATLTFDKQANDLPVKAAKPIVDATKAANRPGLQVEAGGKMIARALQGSPGASELIGLVAAMVILFFSLGSLLAMSLPILAAIFGIGISSVFVVLLSRIITVPPWAPSLALMIGLGVGIDYALFIVVRYRSGLDDGLDPEEANVLALTAAGRAVLFAGCTVIVSLLGMFAMGISFIYGLALAGVAAVLTTMLASLTLVPAVMGFAGDKLAAKGERRHHRDTLAFRWSRQIQRRPGAMASVSLGVLVLLAVPVFSIRLGVTDQGNDPTSWTTRRAYDLLASGFGEGFNGPILLAADLSGLSTQAQSLSRLRLANVAAFARDAQHDPDVAFVTPPQVNASSDAAVVTVIPKGAPQDRSTEQLVHRLRAEIGARQLAVHVGSVTAVGIDSADQAGARLPSMVAAVILLSFLLLTAVFRSILVAVKAAIMNLLSIGAAYGVVVAIFQWGWLGGIIGIGRPGPVDFWAPMMLFTVLFGLSMDYEVFLLSRVREEYLLTGDNRAAVADGLAATARVITAAAAIMIAVFLSFVFGDVRALKLMGLGLATAVLVDATIVRMVLVPATMELLGTANWWLPSSVDRVLPRLGIEAPRELDAPIAAELQYINQS
jgi:RND superfamily putative drug exporter